MSGSTSNYQARPDDKNIQLTIRSEMHKQLQLLKALTGVNVNDYIRQGIAYILEKNQKILNKSIKKT